jgi:serine/threonine-protein kinase
MALRDSNDDTLQAEASAGTQPEQPSQPAAHVSSAPQLKRRLTRILDDGRRFGKYQIIRMIAIGGMSEVYEALHIGLRKRVALKVLRPDLGESVEARQRFVAEGVNAARIRHTNVVDVTDVGIVDDLPYLVMSLLEGEDLGVLYDRRGKIPVTELIDLLLPVAAAVAAGHAKGVVHRDLKPDNIFLHREGSRLIPKVLDFGVSRVMSARRITLNASVFGTPHYMAPEQARGLATDARTDQYALGVILYEGVTGHLPRDSSNPLALLHSVAFDSFRPPSDHVELPPELESIIMRTMAQDPEQRLATMTELALALLPLASPAVRDAWEVELRNMPLDATTLLDAEEIVDDAPPPAVPAAEPAIELRASAPEIVPAPVVRPRRTAERSLVALAMLFALAGGWLFERARSTSPGPVLHPAAISGARRLDFDVETTPPTAQLSLDGQLVAVGHFVAHRTVDAIHHELSVNAPGYVTQTVGFFDAPPPSHIDLMPEPTRLALAPRSRDVAARPLAVASPLHASRSFASSQRVATSLRAKPSANAALRVLDAPVPEPSIAVIDQERPKVRVVDELEPHVQVVE